MTTVIKAHNNTNVPVNGGILTVAISMAEQPPRATNVSLSYPGEGHQYQFTLGGGQPAYRVFNGIPANTSVYVANEGLEQITVSYT